MSEVKKERRVKSYVVTVVTKKGKSIIASLNSKEDARAYLALARFLGDACKDKDEVIEGSLKVIDRPKAVSASGLESLTFGGKWHGSQCIQLHKLDRPRAFTEVSRKTSQ